MNEAESRADFSGAQCGVVDLHFDLPMHLHERRAQPGVLKNEVLPELRAGNIGVVVASVYLEERYLGEQALPVALSQLARLHSEVDESQGCAVCRSYREIDAASGAGKVAFILGLEGVEPLASSLDLLRVFYELGVRVIGLTHARRNAAATGAVFAASGSSTEGLSEFGRKLVRECERLGIIIDLAHINPAGFDEVLKITSAPVIVSHTNARRYYDIERNTSDAQAREIAARGGLVGINSILVSPRAEEATIHRYVDHLQHMVDLIGIDSVALGFDFFEFIYRQWPASVQAEFHARFPSVHFIRDLANHGDVPNLTRKLVERGWSEGQIAQVLAGNALRLFKEVL